MANKETRIWWVALDSLDHVQATFEWGNPANINAHFRVSMDRATWDAMGNPAKLEISVTEDKDV